jgi:hypothetical protein
VVLILGRAQLGRRLSTIAVRKRRTVVKPRETSAGTYLEFARIVCD